MENNIIQSQITDDINYHTPTNTLPNTPNTPPNAPKKNKKSGYYSRNKEERIKYQIEYNSKNQTKGEEYQKSYYEKNKAAILLSRKEKGDVKIVCGCGCEIKKSTLSSHLRTAKHLKLIKSK